MTDTARRPPARPWRRVVRWSALVLGLLVLGVAVLLVRDGLATRAALGEAAAAVEDVVAALRGADVAAAERELAVAQDAVARSAAHTDGPLWELGAEVPIAGRTVRIVRGVQGVAAAATDVLAAALEDGHDLLDADGGLSVRIEAGRVDLTALRRVRELMASLPVDRLAAASGELRGVALGGVPGQVREGRDEALRLADEAVRTVSRAEDATGVLGSLLGVDGPRTYLLAMQTNAELRGTGGLIGFVGRLRVDDGRFTLEPPTVYEPLETEAGAAPVIVEGFGTGGSAEAPADFVRRYDRVGATSHLSNVNVDPDAPTTARVLIDLYEQRTGNEVDGAILLDAVGMEQLLTAIGPVPIPAAARPDPRIPAEIPADQVAEWAMVDVYEVLGLDHSAERGVFLGGFGLSAFQRVFSGEWDGIAVSRQVGTAVAERHLQVFSEDEEEQAALERLGAAGRFGADGDLLAVTANNAVGGKQDVHLGNAFSGEFRLTVDGAGAEAPTAADEAAATAPDAEAATAPDAEAPTGTRAGALRTTVTNPLPDSGMDTYIIGSCAVGRGRGCFLGEPGENLTWFTLWGAAGTRFGELRSENRTDPYNDEPIHGLVTFDVFLRTPSQQEGSFEVDLETPVAYERDGDDLVYRATWWRQAKAIPDHLDLAFTAPEGWTIAEATVTGGGSGTGMGALPDGPPVSAVVDGDVVRLQGAVTADVHLEVRLRR